MWLTRSTVKTFYLYVYLGKAGLDTELERFDHARNVDALNEKRPENEGKPE